ncbi:MAG: hypothetical protein IPL16_15545 [Ignavibacteria bacterium]|nr:hypothetical protein [Ignavibacteria bacterium]
MNEMQQKNMLSEKTLDSIWSFRKMFNKINTPELAEDAGKIKRSIEKIIPRS